jgi:membrane fusion protein (multidrug efflux system)
VLHDQKGQASVLIVDKDNKVVSRPVVTARAQGQNWIVNSGLIPATA